MPARPFDWYDIWLISEMRANYALDAINATSPEQREYAQIYEQAFEELMYTLIAHVGREATHAERQQEDRRTTYLANLLTKQWGPKLVP